MIETSEATPPQFGRVEHIEATRTLGGWSVALHDGSGHTVADWGMSTDAALGLIVRHVIETEREWTMTADAVARSLWASVAERMARIAEDFERAWQRDEDGKDRWPK